MADLFDLLRYGHDAVRFRKLAEDLEAGGAHGFASIARNRANEAQAKHEEKQAQALAWMEVGNELRRIGREVRGDCR